MPAVNCEFLNRPKSLMKDLSISTVCFVYKIQYPCTWLMNIDYRHSNWHNKIMVGEYLMVFQNNTCNKFTIAQNWTLFFHQWLSGDIGYSSVQALHSRLASCECAIGVPLVPLGYHFLSTSFLLFGRVKRVARANGEAARYRSPSPAFESPLACLSCVYFSRYPPKGELARRLKISGTRRPVLFG